MRPVLLLALLVTACGGDASDPPRGAGGAAAQATAGGGGASAGTAGAAAIGGAGAAGGGAAGGASAKTTTIRFHYPTTKTLSLRGDRGGLSWSAGVLLTKTAPDTWTYTTTAIDAPAEVKPLLDDATWSRGPNFRVAPGGTLDAYPRFVEAHGRLDTLDPAFASKHLPDARAVWAYLPPTYVENAAFRAPVLYLHDGQNVFGQAGAFGDWKAQATLDAGAETGAIAEAIVIGVANTQARLDEYTPTFDASEGFGGDGDAYLSLLVDELKPRVDAAYRTLPSREHSGVMGSSLGGLISAYAGVTRGDVFGLVGAMSPSTWWDGRMIVGRVASSPAPRPVRVYVDSGDSGPSSDGVADTKLLAEAYEAAGFTEGATLAYVVEPGGTHDEASWARRLPGALAFLLGPRADLQK
ncbi:MAG: alpha/beta hydrolase [Polyangiaceae bacterium]|nr:alpha/beta hydrolase [Polyangiaceae bacterium]